MVGTLLSPCLAHSIPGSSSVLVSSHLLQEAFLDHLCPPPENLHHELYWQVPFLPPRDSACPIPGAFPRAQDTPQHMAGAQQNE